MNQQPDVQDRVRTTVRGLLERTPAYRELPEATRTQIAHDMIEVGAFLADKDWLSDLPAAREPSNEVAALEALRELVNEVDFPRFVAALVEGVFQAIVDASIQQMQAYAELLASVSAQLDQFADDQRSQASARAPARQRQQMLATMVLMGINRIVVTDGRIKS